MKVFSVNAWRFSRGPVTAGVWDRITSVGTKVQDGEPIEFNALTLGQMVTNFGGQENDVVLCFDHQTAHTETNGQPAPGLARYSALALVLNHKVEKFASHDPGIKAPDTALLADGIYAYRAEITPLGEKLLPNYFYLSPMFTSAGKKENGEALGFQLIDVAATNIPFQDGVGLTFHKFGTEKAVTKNGVLRMSPEMMKKFGLADNATDAEKLAACTKYAEDLEKEKEELSKKMAAFEGKEDPEEEKDEADAEKKMAEELGVEEGPKKMSRCLAALRATRVPQSEVAQLKSQVATFAKQLADRDAAETEKALDAFVAEAIANGQWDSTKADGLKTFARADRKAAEANLLPKGSYTLLSRVAAGKVEGSSRPAVVGTPDRDGVSVMGRELSQAIKDRMAKDKITYSVASKLVSAERPDLVAAYFGR